MKKHLHLLMLILTFIGTAQTNVINYTPTSLNFANPERGFYHHTETLSTGYSSLTASQLENWRENENVTLILRIFYLNGFINSPISASYLNKMQGDFDAMRNAGIKCVIRFAYSNNTNGTYDASKSRMLEHINQVTPYLQNNSDVISVVQAGFIGTWGEWYYTNHFGMPPNNSDYNNRKDIVDALLAALPSDRMVQLRTPDFKRTMYTTNALIAGNAFNETINSRIGHHNDCFLASATDFGTYGNTGVEYPYLSQETAYTVMGGETCSPNLPRSGCTTAVEEMELFHWSYLNADYHSGVLNGFDNDGCMETIKNRLGYRIELDKGSYPESVTDNLNIDIDLYNRGFATIYNPRTAYVVLRNISTNDEYRVALATDPRIWFASTTKFNLNETLSLPANIVDGDYKLFLHLPDADNALSTRPEYAIRLANNNMWESSTGYNNLNATVTVTNEILAIGDNEITNYKVYPIPANDSIIVELENINDYKVSLYNIVGQKVISNVQSESNNTLRMNTQNLQNGVYILNIENDTNKTSRKIVISH